MRHLDGFIARPDGSTQPGRVSFSERIESVGPAAGAVPADYILPGLVDLQVNGGGGVSVSSASVEALEALSLKLAGEGTVAWLATAITAPLEQIERVDAAVAAAMAPYGGADRAGATILGLHLEGPFIAPSRLGAHPPFALEPRGAALERVLKLSSLRLLTLAPELPGACEAVERLCARGVAVSIGHTEATFAETGAALTAGARMFTHLFNVMRPLDHREPGAIGAALAADQAYAAVIADGVHVHPEVLRLVYRAKGASGMILVTDRVSVAEDKAQPGFGASGAGGVSTAPPASLERAKLSAGAARLPDGRLAGSVISMLDGMRVVVEKVGVSVGEAALMAATNPAQVLGHGGRGLIEAGARADLLVVDRGLGLRAVFIGGREVR